MAGQVCAGSADQLPTHPRFDARFDPFLVRNRGPVRNRDIVAHHAIMRRNACDKEKTMGYALVNGHVLDGTLDEQGQMAVWHSPGLISEEEE